MQIVLFEHSQEALSSYIEGFCGWLQTKEEVQNNLMGTKDGEEVYCTSCVGRVVRSKDKEGVSLVRSQGEKTVWYYWDVRKSSKHCIKIQIKYPWV